MQVRINRSTIELVQGDITELETDAIVNAANTKLILGGGVAGAIRNKGGSEIQEDCKCKSPISVGQAVITTGGLLKAKYVIHAVGPKAGEGNENDKLKDVTLNTLKIADENKLKSIGFPAISTGIYGFSVEQCAEIMLGNTIEYLKNQTGLEKVVFCLYSEKDYNIFERQLKKVMDQ